MPTDSILPFEIAVDSAEVDDLDARVRATRWPPEVRGLGWSQGTDLDVLRRLCRYWADGFDWYAVERDLNRRRQFVTEVGGVRLHFVHERAVDGRGIPLILTHGWPSAFVEYLPLIPLLTDPRAHGIDGPSFDVVIPSLPGYAFSERPSTGSSYPVVAELWHGLMQRLGYERYVAGGGDFGSGISTYMALQHPERMLGIYLSHLEIQPTPRDDAPLSDREIAYREHNARYWDDGGGYLAIQSTRPQTLGVALTDSPAGLASWIVEKWRAWGDTGGDVESRFDRDLLLTVVSLYWFTRTATSSARDYVDDRPWFVGDPGVVPSSGTRVSVPVGFSTWPAYANSEGVPPREWVERLYDVRHWTDMPRGGHFAAVEEPALYAADLASFVGDVLGLSRP